MALLAKNQDYIMQHIDPDTGFGLLYSEKNDRCLFLNTVATLLWTMPSDYLDPSLESHIIARSMKSPKAADYVAKVVDDMRRSGLLRPLDAAEAAKSTLMGDEGHTLNQIYFYAAMECNARCYHCYQPTVKVDTPGEQKSNRVGKKILLNFIESALPLGLEHVKITGGEPLLRDDLGEIIRGIRRLGPSVALETNGSLIDEKAADMLAEEEVEVAISLDGGSEAVHDSLRGLPGSFQKATRAMRMLSDRGCEPQAIMSVSRRNVCEIEKTIRMAASNGCRLVKINPISTFGSAERLKGSNIMLTVNELIDLYKRRADLEARFGVSLFFDLPPSFSSPYEIASGRTGMCPFKNMLGVLPDGSISFCGIGNIYRDLIFGRIDDEGFDIQRFWQEAEALIEIRSLLSGKLDGVCGLCVFESFCKGSCRAHAYGESRSFLAPDPLCQRAFDEGIFPDYYLRSLKRR